MFGGHAVTSNLLTTVTTTQIKSSAGFLEKCCKHVCLLVISLLRNLTFHDFSVTFLTFNGFLGLEANNQKRNDLLFLPIFLHAHLLMFARTTKGPVKGIR